MIYWYWTRNGTIINELGLKLNLAKNALLRQPTDAAFIRINLTIKDNDPSKTSHLAIQFIANIFPTLKDVLPFEK